MTPLTTRAGKAGKRRAAQPGLQCESCGRSEYQRDGYTLQLEVCRDVVRDQWLCKRCFITGDDKKPEQQTMELTR